LIFGFFLLTLGIESTALRDGSLYHPQLLVYLAQSGEVTFDLKRDGIDAS
jgi:hypothetical protein